MHMSDLEARRKETLDPLELEVTVNCDKGLGKQARSSGAVTLNLLGIFSALSCLFQLF